MHSEGEPVQILDPATAYARWASSYPPHAHNPLMQAEERAMLSLLPSDLRGHTVLDAGCGSGRYLIHALRRGAPRLAGVDLSREMLQRACAELKNAGQAMADTGVAEVGDVQLIQGALDALPLRNHWADLTICGLTIGHLHSLEAALSELRRVTRPGGWLFCSDFHPLGHALGWRREFSAGGKRYAVRHTPHLYADWQRACAALGWRIERKLEPRLEQADIPVGARFDSAALEMPVAIALGLRNAG